MTVCRLASYALSFLPVAGRLRMYFVLTDVAAHNVLRGFDVMRGMP